MEEQICPYTQDQWQIPYLDMSCDDQFKRNCPVKHTLLVVSVTVLQLCIYIPPMFLKQTKNRNE